MKKLWKRLIIFFVGGPFILSLIYYIPYYNFFAYHILAYVSGIISNFEIHHLLSQKIKCYPKYIISAFGIILLTIAYLSGLGIFPRFYIIHGFWIEILLIMSIEILFSFNGNFKDSINRIISAVFMLVYPWGLLIYFSIATALPYANKAITTFFLMTFACDSIAWFFGILFGKNNRGLIKASPKKSIAGFIGGFAGSLCIGFIVYFLFKEFRNFLPQLIIISLLTAAAAIIGDIVESILKRAADIKDSGKIILGRGGILDSMDSLLFAIPVFYISYKFLIGGF